MYRRYRKYFLLALGMVLSLLLLSSTLNLAQPTKHAASYPRMRHNASAKTILLWNNFFSEPNWVFPRNELNASYFREQLKCPVYNCEVSNQHDFLPAINMYDAVVFHVAREFSDAQPLPQLRASHQQYVFAVLESPRSVQHDLSGEAGFYNLTMSYRLDSDLVWSYDQALYDSESNELIAPALQPRWRQAPMQPPDLSQQWYSIWQRKSKMAAWFVSNCRTDNQRLQLAKAIQRYVQVDIYGACGAFRCQHNSEKCMRLLENDYKFYFAFENSMCVDYVTEKLYNILNRNIIPVVYGGANYTRFLPPNSYINAEAFDTVEDLASYLQYVGSNAATYASFFWWRQHYRLSERHVFCDLCEILNRANQSTKTYDNIDQWWNEFACRSRIKIRF